MSQLPSIHSRLLLPLNHGHSVIVCTLQYEDQHLLVMGAVLTM